MHHRRFLTLWVVLLPLAACDNPVPVAGSAHPPRSVAETKKAMQAAAVTRERREYSSMPDGLPATQTYSTTTEAAIQGEAMRGGPHGEARIFENAEEQAELARGHAPKFMNGQFRYYLAGVQLVQPQGECKTPLLAIRLAVENLHGASTSSIYGRFTFAQTVGAEGSALTETIAIPYRADIIGPFSDKQGGISYVTAYAEQSDAFMDPGRWGSIAGTPPARLKAFFTPEVFYYPDGTQYAARSGSGPAARQVMTCGGAQGAAPVLAR